MGLIIYSFNLKISPTCHMVWYCYVTELHAYHFVIKDCVIKRGHYLCQTLYIFFVKPNKIILFGRKWKNIPNQSEIRTCVCPPYTHSENKTLFVTQSAHFPGLPLLSVHDTDSWNQTWHCSWRSTQSKLCIRTHSRVWARPRGLRHTVLGC